MSDEEGASYREQLLDASRRNNEELLRTIFDEIQDPAQIAHLINETTDPLGNSPIHLATKYGYYNVLDLLLDQEGVEIDPQNRLDGETPLHFAVKYTYDDLDYGAFLVEFFIDVGADPRIKSKHGERPIDLVRGDDEQHQKIRDMLEQAEYAAMLAHDAHRAPVDQADDAAHTALRLSLQEGEPGEGSASESESESESEATPGSAGSASVPAPPAAAPPPPPPN